MKSLKTVARYLAYFVIAYLLLIGAGRLAQRENGAGVLAVVLLVVALAWIVRTVSRTGSRIPFSGRDPGDVGPIDTLYDSHGGGHTH